MDFNDALVLVGFPTTGSVASIAVHYLREKVDLPLVGAIEVDGMPAVAAVKDGIATAPVRIFGGEVECKLPKGQCPRLYVIVADLPMEPRLVRKFAEGVLAIAAGCKLLVSLDGVVRGEGSDEVPVYAASPDPAILADLDLPDVGPLSDAFIGGMTGELLLSATAAGVRVGALVVEADQDMPDGRAAAALIRAVDDMTPLVPIDAEPLLAEALELERRIRAAQEQAERQVVDVSEKPLRSFV